MSTRMVRKLVDLQLSYLYILAYFVGSCLAIFSRADQQTCKVQVNRRFIEIFLPSGECQEDMQVVSTLLDILPELITANSTVVDVAAETGLTYTALAELLGSKGSIIAIEKSTENFDILQRNAARLDSWNQTLLLNGNPGKVHQLDDAHTITSIINQIGLGCPHMIRLNHHNGVAPYETYTSLLGSFGVLMHCLPVLLIDCVPSDVAGCIATIELLSGLRANEMGRYELSWYTLNAVWSRDTAGAATVIRNHTTNTLLALPAGHPAAPSLKGRGVVSPVYGLDLPTFDPLSPTRWEAVSNMLANVSSTPDDAGRHRVSVTVRLADIAAWNTSLHNTLHNVGASAASDGVRYRNIGSLLRSAGLHQRTLVYDHHPNDTFETLHLAGSAHCFLWASSIDSHITATASVIPGWHQELFSLQTACAAFFGKRLRTLQAALRSRWEQQVQDLQSLREATNAGVTVEGDAVLGASAMYSYYELPNAEDMAVGSVWFERAPLTMSYDEVTCAEPLWCDHTIEIQRRIRAWQFPEEVSLPLPEHVRFSGQDSAAEDRGRSRSRDWSVRPHLSAAGSCAQSKFLVYEPPSHAHGLGSLLELIAATFRYAICLDRILILNPLNQSATLTKWMHPGCHSSFAECYFEPISGCHLSEADILSAPVSPDGHRFDQFPLREERVLVLKGMPVTGHCALCHSGWKEASRFFDGLFMGDAALDSSVALLHMSAFRSTIKATWASQFLRFLLRPRPWVQEAISQLLHASMRSPLATGGFLGASVPPAHALRSFPRRFLSLHVRFGMKAAETELQPLSKYLSFVARKLPEVTDIFVSTETEQAIQTLISEYPNYRFHFMKYPRREYLDLALKHQGHAQHRDTDFVEEMLYSLANLHAAAEAHAFVGTLSSNWCMMIMQLERTRGDGGFDYYSMDGGSAFTSCF